MFDFITYQGQQNQDAIFVYHLHFALQLKQPYKLPLAEKDVLLESQTMLLEQRVGVRSYQLCFDLPVQIFHEKSMNVNDQIILNN